MLDQTIELCERHKEALAEIVRLRQVNEALRGETARLRQGLWDVFRELGGDTDGDPTPDALVSDIVPLVLELAKDVRKELDEDAEKGADARLDYDR